MCARWFVGLVGERNYLTLIVCSCLSLPLTICFCGYLSLLVILYEIFFEENLEVRLPTIWTDGKAEVGRVREEEKK